MAFITQSKLLKLLRYDSKTGHFYWRKWRTGVRKNRMVGCHAQSGGSKGRSWYVIIGIDGKIFSAHRLAYQYVTGKIPRHIDHINHNDLDNRWKNLREIAKITNHHNSRRQLRNISGYTGVTWRADRNKWQARIVFFGKTTFLGYFTKLQEAVAIRKTAELKFGFHPNHGKT